MKNNELVTTTRPASHVKRVYKLSTRDIKSYYHNNINIYNKWIAENKMEVGQDSVISFFEHLKSNYQKRRFNPETKLVEQITATRSISTLQKYRAGIMAGFLAILKANRKDVSLLQEIEIKEFFKSLKIGKRSSTKITEDKILNNEELKTLQKKAGKKTAILVRALFDSALRVSELCNLKLSNCTINNTYVSIETTGKGNKQIHTAISIGLYEEIRSIYPGTEYLFTGSTGKAIRSETCYKLIRRAGKKFLNRNISPHSLRHSKATAALKHWSLDKVSEHLNHSSPATTAQFYIHSKPSSGDVVALNQILKST